MVEGATAKAAMMMLIALPTMFLVIIGLMLATVALRKAFPAEAEEQEEED